MKTALITGASGGIGSAIALKFAQNGYNVVLNYHTNRPAAESIKQRIMQQGAKAISFCADIRIEAEVDGLFNAAEKSFGMVDVLVNNAGKTHFGLLTDLSYVMWEDLIRTNLTSAFLCSKRALKNMVTKKQGSIINIGSIWGESGASCEVAYSAAKAGLSGMTKALSKEVGPSGIRVNCIAPGYISTKMNAALSAQETARFLENVALNRCGLPEDIAQGAMFLAQSEYTTGETLHIDGGML